MSFVEQEDVFRVIENLFKSLFDKFSDKKIKDNKFPQIKYEDSMLKYGTDKPDLRNPLIINDVTNLFTREDVSLKYLKFVKEGQ